MVPKSLLLKYNPLKVFGIGKLHVQHSADNDASAALQQKLVTK